MDNMAAHSSQLLRKLSSSQFLYTREKWRSSSNNNTKLLKNENEKYLFKKKTSKRKKDS